MTEPTSQYLPTSAEPKQPSLLAYAGVAAAIVVGGAIPNMLFRNANGLLRSAATGLGAFGLGYLAVDNFMKPPKPTLPVPPVGQALMAFPGLSAAVPPTPQMIGTFMQHAMGIATQAPAYHHDNPNSPLNNIVRNLAEKGMTTQASALRKHLISHGRNHPFYTALDAWLEEIARTRPETAQHIQRQSVLLAMAIDAHYPNVSPERREKLFTQGMFAGALHDVGKLAIAPELLDKSSRIPRQEMTRVLQAYKAAVTDYPEKHDDIKFLEMANGGRVFFAKHVPSQGETIGVGDYLARIDRQPLAGEPGFADDTMKLSAEHIYARIKQKAAQAHILLFTPQEEAALLNRSRRGTLTEQEGAVMAAHDQIGTMMLQAIGIPHEIGIHPNVINMDKGAKVPNKEQTQLREWILLSDIAEAVTGQRAYNRENGKNLTPDEALQVLAREAEHGMLKPETVQQFAASGLMQRYATLYPDIPTQRQVPAPHIQAASVQHAKEISPDLVTAL